MDGIKHLNDDLYADLTVEELEERLEMTDASCSSFECVQHNGVTPPKEIGSTQLPGSTVVM
jgi:hypothetical protein